MRRLTTEEFIEKARKVHGDKYDYSKVEYKNKRSKVTIICPKHGEFTQYASCHLQGEGCPECGLEKIKTVNLSDLPTFISKAKEIHGDKYDFSEVKEYKGNKVKVEVICNKCGRHFFIRPNDVLSGHGCRCYHLKPKVERPPRPKKVKIPKVPKKPRKISIEEVKDRIEKLGNGNFQYDINEYVNTQKPITFKCLTCGHVFKRDLNLFRYVHTCPNCNKKKISQERTKTTEEYVQQCKEKYGDLYDYSETVYTQSSEKVRVKCNECGKFFEIEANSHLQGHGCPNHYRQKSKLEEEIYKFLSSITEHTVVQSYRGNKEIMEIDVYIPDLNFGVELDGLYWHNEMNRENDYHLKKTVACEKNGIRLFHVFEDEWLYKKDIIKSMLRNAVGKTENKIMARKCEICEVGSSEAGKFLDENHLQGKCSSALKYGLYYNGELVSLMTFGKSRHFVGNGKSEWELLRFCNKLNTNVVGAASKLFKYFLMMNNPSNVVSYADRRWSSGNLYNKLGFTLYNKSKPSYYYVIGDKKYYRFNYRKSVLMEKYGCPQDMSEHDFCKSMKWYRIYDCGCLCYIWKKEK